MASRRRQIEDLRGLLAQPPSRALFRKLLRTIGRWGGDLSDAPLEYAFGIVSRWPDSVHRPMPARWVDLALRGRAPRASRLCGHLDLSGHHLDAHLAGMLSEQPHLGDFYSMSLRGDPGALRDLFDRLDLRGLRRLRIQSDLTDADLAGLLERPSMATLHTLDLGPGSLTSSAGDAIAASAAAATLEKVVLADNPLGDNGLCALLDGDPLPRLASLDGARCGATLDTVSVLARSPARARLARLMLDQADLGPGLARVLTRDAERLPLAHLGVAGAGIEDRGMRALIEASRVKLYSLETLDASQNGITDAGLRNMSARVNFPNLRRLDLRWNLITDAGAYQLAPRRAWQALESLDLEGNEVRMGRLQKISFKRTQ